MQFVVLGHFNDRFNEMSPEQQKEGSHAEWAKSRDYYAKGYLRRIWVYEDDQGIMSLFETDSREHMETLLADYPGVKAGWVTAEIRLLEPYWGFFPELAEQRNRVTGHGDGPEPQN
jgi:muconolactone delta-isomerase